MTEYKQAWLDLIADRDMFYIQMLAIAIVGYALYCQFFRRVFRLVMAVALVMIVLGLSWGLLHITEKGDQLWAWLGTQ